MARIRSVHPGQWSDEDFVSCSFAARLLALGLRNEADDRGVFEWKPTQLKMRLFPADNVDVSALLAEIEATGQVRKYAVGGRQYGWIKNFDKFQRPKFPKYIHPTPPWLDGITENHDDDGEEIPPNEEIAPQRESEEGIGGGSSESKPKASGGRLRLEDLPEDFQRFWRAYPKFDGNPLKPAWLEWQKALGGGAVAAEIIAAASRYADALKKPDAPKPAHARTWLHQARWNDWGGSDAHAKSPAEIEAAFRSRCEHFLIEMRKGATWPTWLGPAPGAPGCKVPADLIAKYGS